MFKTVDDRWLTAAALTVNHEKNMEKKYVPIDCNFYDEIEILAMRKNKTTVIYLSENDVPTTIEGIIKNVYAKNKEEFLEMESGLIFRLDRLVSLDGKIVPGSCEM